MAKSTGDAEKTYPLSLRLSKELESVINQEWKTGPFKDLSRSQFILYLLRLGVDEHLKRETRFRADAENDFASDATKHNSG